MTRKDRATRFAALGDVHRLEIVDQLMISDRTPRELSKMCCLSSNLLAHHLDVLESAKLIRRRQSSGDRRNRYVALEPRCFEGLLPATTVVHDDPARLSRALFVCRRNSARSQLAAALWNSRGIGSAESAGTHPAEVIHPNTIEAAKRANLRLPLVKPRHIDDVTETPDIVVTVCDEAREEIEVGENWLHWSLPDPVQSRSVRAFERTIEELNIRINSLRMTLSQTFQEEKVK